MLNKKVADLLNDQINKELYSAYLYLDMSNYFERRGLNGFANWYMIQAQEERDHAMLFYRYMQNNDCPVTLGAIAKPDKVFKKDMDVLKAGLEHEEYVTASIHTIYDAANKVKDFRTMQFLDWFVSAATPAASICSTRSSPPVPTAPPAWCSTKTLKSNEKTGVRDIVTHPCFL